MARRKTRKRRTTSTKRKSAVKGGRSKSRKNYMVPFYGAQPPAKKRRSFRKYIPKKSFFLDSFFDAGSVLLGSISGNVIKATVPVVQPIAQSIINVATGLLVMLMAGKNKRVQLGGVGLVDNGMLQALRELFPKLPYLSGEQVEITPLDVDRAVAVGKITEQEGIALKEALAMQGYESMMGMSQVYAGELQSFAGLEDSFVTTEDV